MEILGIDYYWIWLELVAGIGLIVWGILLAIRENQDDIHIDFGMAEYSITFGLVTSITGTFISVLMIIGEASEFIFAFTIACVVLLVLSVIFLLVASKRIKKKTKGKKIPYLP